jgi:hypothetical protein
MENYCYKILTYNCYALFTHYSKQVEGIETMQMATNLTLVTTTIPSLKQTAKGASSAEILPNPIQSASTIKTTKVNKQTSKVVTIPKLVDVVSDEPLNTKALSENQLNDNNINYQAEENWTVEYFVRHHKERIQILNNKKKIWFMGYVM